MDLLKFDRFQPGIEQVNKAEREKIGAGAVDEQGRGAESLIDDPAQRRHHHSADRAARSADADDRRDRVFGETIRNNRVEIGRPPLMRSGRKPDERDGRPNIRRERRGKNRRDRASADQKRRFSRAVRGPSGMEKMRRKPSAGDTADI